MSLFQQDIKTPNKEDDDYVFAALLAHGLTLPMVMKTAVELGLLEIISDGNPNNERLSASEIASKLPTTNPDAPVILDRLLRLLASQSILTCELGANKDGDVRRLYGLAPVAKYFVANEDGVSLAPMLLFGHQKPTGLDCWNNLKNAILEGGTPFEKAHGMKTYEYFARDKELSDIFNKAMHNRTTIVMKRILEMYKGFEHLHELVDVGGGVGANLAMFVSRYPHIKGINFDLPHVIRNAPPYKGVEHVAGDMFDSVPEGEAIFLKKVLHNWSDEQCLKIVKNCYDALPNSGKVIVVESVAPELPETDPLTRFVFSADVSMFQVSLGGKERTEKEFKNLARAAGFAGFEIICSACGYCVIEFQK